MALGYLMIMFVVLAAVSIVCIILMFAVKGSKTENIIIAIGALLGLLLGILSYTSLPENWTGSKTMAGCFALLALIGALLKGMHRPATAKLLVSASIVLGMLQLFFF